MMIVDASDRQRPRVSVVEDDASMRASLTDLLDSFGYDSLAFESSEHFIRSGEMSTTDVIITDIQMGLIDGIGLLERVRQSQSCAAPVIIITALSDEVLRRTAESKGCFAYLQKPFDPEILLARVREAIADRDVSPSST